jgi:hypothetical protein
MSSTFTRNPQGCGGGEGNGLIGRGCGGSEGGVGGDGGDGGADGELGGGGEGTLAIRDELASCVSCAQLVDAAE